jgi:hypothetical protein
LIKKITPSTKAILLTHILGYNGLSQRILDICNEKDIYLIEDVCESHGATFQGKEQSYRFYVERLFRFFEKIGATTFLITETQQIPEVFSPTGVEEFLADGVIVIYNIRRQNTRQTAIEVLKMRGIKHQKKIVSMSITDKGIVVYSSTSDTDPTTWPSSWSSVEADIPLVGDALSGSGTYRFLHKFLL